MVGICSGGEMQKLLSEEVGSICLNVPSGQMPRSAFGHILGTQLSACWALGILKRPDSEEISQMLDRLSKYSHDADLSHNSGMPASLSRSLLGRELGIVSPTCLGPAAYRFCCQLNENSAKFARSTEIPEMNHNEIVAWTSDSSKGRAMLVFSCDDIHPRNRARIDWVLENVGANPTWIIECEGKSLLERLLSAAQITDWVSIGLAVLMEKDPTEMPAIVSLKSHLSRI